MIPKSIALFGAFAMSTSAASAGTQTGRVAQLLVRASDGLTYVYLEGTAGGKPSCASIAYWMIKAESSLAGKQQYAMLLAAKLSGRPVTIWGANTCTRWGDGEDIEMVSIQD